ncbi:hypothetical protein CJI59_37115, partial [Streptomyces sp. Alain-F2R5]
MRAATRDRQTARNRSEPTPTAYRVPAASQVNGLPAPFAGGQVASGTQVGILGNKSIFDTPFSIAGYTKDLIQSIQAKNVSDVLERDPAVTVGSNSSYYDVLSIRGFPYNANDVALNGLYGVAPGTTYPVELFDRIEVLRGPQPASVWRAAAWFAGWRRPTWCPSTRPTIRSRRSPVHTGRTGWAASRSMSDGDTASSRNGAFASTRSTATAMAQSTGSTKKQAQFR